MSRQKIDRKELIRTSLGVFKEKGYHKTTMADIADACGLLKGSIYHYVESKESLMMEVLETLKEHYVKKVFQWAYEEEYEPEDRLKILAKKAEETYLDEKGGNFFVNIGLETRHVVPAFDQVIQEFFHHMIEALAFLYAYKTNEKDARLLAEIVVAEVEGAAIMSQLLNDDEYLLRTNKKMVEEFANLKTK
jgi:TetR/AcrR family transcriptional repressor of nem operon